MNKLEEKLSYKNHNLPKPIFTEERQYRRQRHNSYESEEFIARIDENVSLASKNPSIQIHRSKMTSKTFQEYQKQAKKNDAPKKSRMKYAENFSPFSRDDKNIKFSGSRKQNNEKYCKKSSNGINIYENTEQFDRKNDICKIENKFSSTDKNDLSRSMEYNRVFESINKLNIKPHDELNYLDVSTDTEEYWIPDDESKNCKPNSTITNKEDNLYAYQNHELIDLLYFNADLMQDEQLFEYSFSLKSKILEKIFEFEDSEKAKLQFLCELTDGTQTQKNQKLITKRMYHVIHKVFETVPVEPRLKGNYFVSKKYAQSSDDVSNVGEEYSLSSDYEEDEQNARPMSDVEFGEEISERNCNTEKRSAIINESRGEQSVPEILDNSSTPNLDVKKTISGNDYSWNSFFVLDCLETSPNIINQGKTSVLLEEPFKNHSMLNMKETKSVSDDLSQYKDSTYSYFGLENLLNYDVDAMYGSSLVEYAFALKKEILLNISKFNDPTVEMLELLCELTDGTQLEANQRLITMRMCDLVNISLRKRPEKHDNHVISKHHHNYVKSKKYYDHTNSRKQICDKNWNKC